MSAHSLPPDRSSWPTDPYRLLGVRRGVSPRDLRKAYLHLVRVFKPEHAPEEFRLIRAAYESLQEGGERTASRDVDDWSRPVDATRVETASPPPDGEEETAFRSDPWKRAMRGEIDEAYRELAAAASTGSAGEEVYLQLYWLLHLGRRVDAGRPPCDWLIRGLRDCGRSAARLRALLVREAASDPELAVGDRFKAFLTLQAPVSHLSIVAGSRWRAARESGRWKVIVGDLSALRGWVPRADPNLWTQLVSDAATNMAWAPRTEQGPFRLLKTEAEQFASQNLQLAHELSSIEYVEHATSGLNRLWSRHEWVPGLHDLLRLTWNQPAPVARARLMAHLAEVSADPVGWFGRFDTLRSEASAALQMLMELPGQLGIQPPSPSEHGDPSDVSLAVADFLASQRWWHYLSLRPRLLSFCLAEMVSPDALARLIRGRADLRLPDTQHLADVITSDWPLTNVYRGCEIVRD